MIYAELNSKLAALREAIRGRNHLTVRSIMIDVRDLRKQIAKLEATNKND